MLLAELFVVLKHLVEHVLSNTPLEVFLLEPQVVVGVFSRSNRTVTLKRKNVLLENFTREKLGAATG